MRLTNLLHDQHSLWHTNEWKCISHSDNMGTSLENDHCAIWKSAMTLALHCVRPLCQAEDSAHAKVELSCNQTKAQSTFSVTQRSFAKHVNP